MKALCFDLDGTLVDTWESERLVRLCLLEELSKHIDTAQELVVAFYDVTWAPFKDSYMNMLDRGYGEMNIRAMHLSRVFDELMRVRSRELGHHKPSKIIFDEMIRRINTELGKIAYIGDTYMNDVLGVQDTGWRTVWVNRVDDVPCSIQPECTISELTEHLGLF